MATALNGSAPTLVTPALSDLSVAIVTTSWNSKITHALRQGAIDFLTENGFDPHETVMTFEVPGAIELTFAASQLIETGRFDAIIVLGCVIRGGTPHFDYVCQSVTQGITTLNADVDTPVIFGVLTVDNEQDALDRAGGPLGNKGTEAAQAALAMVAFKQHVDNMD